MHTYINGVNRKKDKSLSALVCCFWFNYLCLLLMTTTTTTSTELPPISVATEEAPSSNSNVPYTLLDGEGKQPSQPLQSSSPLSVSSYIVYEECQHAVTAAAGTAGLVGGEFATLAVSDLLVVDRTSTFAAAELALRAHLQRTLPSCATVTWEHDDIPPSSLRCSVTYNTPSAATTESLTTITTSVASTDSATTTTTTTTTVLATANTATTAPATATTTTAPATATTTTAPATATTTTATATTVGSGFWAYLFGAPPPAVLPVLPPPPLSSTPGPPTAEPVATSTYPTMHRFGILLAPSATARLSPPLFTGGPPVVVEGLTAPGTDANNSAKRQAEVDDNWFVPVTSSACFAAAPTSSTCEEEEFVTVPESNRVPPLHTSNLIMDTPPEAEGFVTVTTVDELIRAEDSPKLLLATRTPATVAPTAEPATTLEQKADAAVVVLSSSDKATNSASEDDKKKQIESQNSGGGSETPVVVAATTSELLVSVAATTETTATTTTADTTSSARVQERIQQQQRHFQKWRIDRVV